MTTTIRPLLLAVPVALLLVPLGEGQVAPTPYFVPDVAQGFAVTPLAALPGTSAIAFGPGDADGPDLYATTLLGNVVRLSLTWTPAGPVLIGLSVVASGFNLPLGLIFDGAGTLYVADSHEGAESGRVDGVLYRVEPSGPRAVVDGLPNGRHNTNHLRFGPDARLYLANGNPNDNGVEGGDADVFPYSGALLSVDAAQVSASPAVLRWRDGAGNPIPPDQVASHPLNADFAAKVRVLAYGFRNVYGIAFSPQGIAYTGMNGADSPDSQDALFKVAPGTNYGFPFCYNVGPPGGVGAQVRVAANPRINDPSKCVGVPPATALIGWHTCATGLDVPRATGPGFPAAFRNSVYVGECAGFFLEALATHVLEDPVSAPHSTSHKVRRVVLDAQGDAMEVRDFLSGLTLPTDVLFGPDGAMYVADIEKLLRVAPVQP